MDREWDYGTRLNNGTVLKDHDDWDCLDDLVHEGLVIRDGRSEMKVKLTRLGMEMAGKLRIHKMKGGSFSTFRWSCESNGS
jgi:hypothetical protein